MPKEKIKRLVIISIYSLNDDDLKHVMAFERVKLKLSKNITNLLESALINKFLPRKELAFDDCWVDDRDFKLRVFICLS